MHMLSVHIIALPLVSEAFRHEDFHMVASIAFYGLDSIIDEAAAVAVRRREKGRGHYIDSLFLGHVNRCFIPIGWESAMAMVSQKM